MNAVPYRQAATGAYVPVPACPWVSCEAMPPNGTLVWVFSEPDFQLVCRERCTNLASTTIAPLRFIHFESAEILRKHPLPVEEMARQLEKERLTQAWLQAGWWKIGDVLQAASHRARYVDQIRPVHDWRQLGSPRSYCEEHRWVAEHLVTHVVESNAMRLVGIAERALERERGTRKKA